MKLKDKKVLVCGLGRTGIATIPLLLDKGAKVTIQTENVIKEYEEEVKKFEGLGVKVFLSKEPNDVINNFDICVVSPGINTSKSFFKIAEEIGVQIISEIELSNWFFEGTLVAITGTNGKTTTTTLVQKILAEKFSDSRAVGNIGIPFSANVLNSTKDSIYALELSSYQLETTYTLKPKVATVLNIAQDHIERHKTMQNYISAKEKIFENQDENDYLILNYDNEGSMKMKSLTKSKVIYFSKEEIQEDCLKVYVKDNEVFTNFNGVCEKVLNLSDILLIGTHNVENVLASIALTLPLGLDVKEIEEAIMTFKGVEHRLEYVNTFDGVTYINDSKATNPDSSINAINAITQPTVLIVGGFDKNLPIFEFVKNITKKVKHLVIIGEVAEKYVECCNKLGYSNFTVCETLESAVVESSKVAKSGDCVLLSPACSSFDMFKDFEHRGKVFKEAVYNLRR